MSSRTDPNQKPPADWREGFRAAGPYVGLGMQLAGAMVLFTLGGYFLDGRLHTTPWLTVLGGILGMVAVFVQLIRTSQEMSRKSGSKVTRTASKKESGGSGTE